jgi:CO/xanthine dehydrogenase FAD-binding subunit
VGGGEGGQRVTRSFTSATTVEEAVEALGTGARPVAGGTDLVVGARQGKAPLPDAIVAIDRIDALRHLSEAADGGMHLGALVSHAAVVASDAVRSRFTALADASAIVGSHATRANGTIGGNVMNASPAMDTGGPLLCFDATVTLRGTRGERTVPIGELWTGPGLTMAAADELLVGIDMPAPRSGTGSAYVRLEYRRQMEIAVVGATAAVSVEGGSIVGARIAITALAPTIRRVAGAEATLAGSDGGEGAIAAAARAAADGSAPIDDVRASAAYRSAMAEVVARRAIHAALTRARGGEIPVPASDALYGG